MEKYLSELKPGENARIKKITSSPGTRKMLGMGIITGAVVKVDRVAPLGDPIEITVRGYHLSLRRSEAANILVEVI